MKKVLKYGCLTVIIGIALLFLAAFLYEMLFVSDEEKAERTRVSEEYRKQEEDSAAYFVNRVIVRMHNANKKLSNLKLDTIPMRCQKCAEVNTASVLYQRVSKEELEQFTDSGFQVKSALYWGPWLTKNMQVIEQNYSKSKTPQSWDLGEVKENAKDILKRDYLIVFIPIIHNQPRLVNDEHFETGYYYGWIVLMQADTGEPLGYSLMRAIGTLEKVESEQWGVGVGPIKIPIVGDGIKEKLDKNFSDEFFRSTDLTVRYIMYH